MATVTDIFLAQQQYAAGVGTTVDGLLATLNDLSSIDVTITEPDAAGHTFYDAVNSFAAQLIAAAPVMEPIDAPQVSPPTAPTITIEDVAPVVMPTFSESAPTSNIPSPPSLVFPSTPGAAPAFEQPPIPEAPSLVFPAVPTLSQLNLPSPPSVDLPSFIATAPVNTLTPPANNFTWAEEAYSSAMLDAVKSKLLTDLQDGGYGIDSNDEVRLFDRALEREVQTAEQNVEEVARGYAGRGYPVPPGAFYGALERARQGYQDAASTASREITLRRSELFVQNRQFTIQQATQVETILINFHQAKLERLLNAAKFTAEVAISYYNAQREDYLAHLDGYKTEAAVFESLVRAQVEKLNIYRAQLDGERLKGEIDRNRLDAYRAQLAGLETQVALYRTRMQAAEVQASIERIKLEAFRSNVDAYVAQVKGKELEFQAFDAAVRGEESKARVYEIKVRAHAAIVDGLKTQVDANATRVRAQTERANSQIALYNADSLRYRTEFEANLDVERLEVQQFQALVEAYRARAGAMEGLSRVAIANYEANSRDYIAALRHNVDRALLQLKVGESNRDFKVNTKGKLVDFYIQQVVGALSGINALATQVVNE